MNALLLLAATTTLYAGYNLFVKQSADHIGTVATTTIGATIALQIAALSTSLIFALILKTQGGHSISLPTGAYAWAMVAGLCIGIAEILYFYLFAGIAGMQPLRVSVVTPTIVAGTIVITLLAAWLLFGEILGGYQLLGALFVVVGILLLFVKS
jgi:drug/metabolite transporter (DMT)-like permease